MNRTLPNPVGKKIPRVASSIFAIHLFVGLLVTAANAQSPATAQRLNLLRTAYEAAYAKEVAAAHTSALADLDAKYTAALDRALATATQAGELDTALALRDEKKRLASAAQLPADDFAAPETLKTLRLTYRSALASLEVRRDQTASPVKAKYDAALEALQKELTKSNDLDGALAVRSMRESLKTEKAPEPPKPAAVVFEETQKPQPQSPANKTAADDPEAALKLAQWAFATERSIHIITNGHEKPVEIKNEADLPKGSWMLFSINAGQHNPNAPELFPWEQLPKVPSLKALGVNQKQPLTPEQAAHLQALPKLIKLDIANMTFTLPALEAFPVFARMDHLKLGKYHGEVAPVMKLIGEKCPELPILELNFPVPVELLPGPKDPLASLKDISVSGPVTPEMVQKLVKLPLLKAFETRDCREESLPADLLLPMKHFKYIKIRRCKAMTALLPSLSEFENLDFTILQLNTGENLPPAALETLAKLKSRRLELDGGLSKNLGDEHIDALSKVKGVQEMRLLSHQITPEGTARLKKALPKCKITL